MLHEGMSENVLWMNTIAGQKLGLADGDTVTVAGPCHKGRMMLQLTDMIHPEAVFMLHGFGHTLPVESRAFGKGVADNKLMCSGLDVWDPAGGAVAMQENFITVTKE